MRQYFALALFLAIIFESQKTFESIKHLAMSKDQTKELFKFLKQFDKEKIEVV
ncbi:MAG TPA: hypothetical protein VFV08_12155 [Puia sp.]|nr:hypothetical protein [Puia sp.]